MDRFDFLDKGMYVYGAPSSSQFLYGLRIPKFVLSGATYLDHNLRCSE